jgi:thioredoxin 1
MLAELDEATFAPTLAGFDGLAVVEFYAPWCRSCRGCAPVLDRLVETMAAEAKYDAVKFFRVNFKANKQLALRERVFALPTVHFYTPLGRVNRFTLTPAKAARKMKTEVDRYVGDSGHLALLSSLREKPNPMSPVVRFKLLTGFLQALQDAESYLMDAATGKDIAEMMKNDARRIQELEELFAWMDTNDDGYIDADELEAVAAAVGTMAPSAHDAAGEGDATVDLHEFYVTLLGQATALLQEESPLEDPEEAPALSGARVAPALPEGAALDFASFVRLMTSKAVSEFQKPDQELLPIFEALDANGDGVITREEMRQAMACVARNLPIGDAEAWARRADDAFEALDRDKSGKLDYEEFVALMSGCLTSPYAL